MVKEPVMEEAAPTMGAEVTVGGLTEVPLATGAGKPETDGAAGVGTTGAGAEVKVGIRVVAGHELTVTVTVEGTAAAWLWDITGTAAAWLWLITGAAWAVVDGTGMMVVVIWPTGQLVTVGAQLVMVLTMVVKVVIVFSAAWPEVIAAWLEVGTGKLVREVTVELAGQSWACHVSILDLVTSRSDRFKGLLTVTVGAQLVMVTSSVW